MFKSCSCATERVVSATAIRLSRLPSSFEYEVRSDAVFGRVRRILVVVPGSKDVEVIASYAENRIWSQASGDDSCVSNGNVVAFGQQSEIPLQCFAHRLVKSQ